jgi:hypothetical protein
MATMLSRQPSAPVCHEWSTPVTTTQSPGPSGCGPSSRTRLTFPDRTTLRSTVSVWCIGISRAGSNSTRYQRASPGTDGVGSRSWCPIGRAGGGDSFVSNRRFNPTPGMNVRKSANSRSSTTHDFPSWSIPVISPRTCISFHPPLAAAISQGTAALRNVFVGIADRAVERARGSASPCKNLVTAGAAVEAFNRGTSLERGSCPTSPYIRCGCRHNRALSSPIGSRSSTHRPSKRN